MSTAATLNSSAASRRQRVSQNLVGLDRARITANCSRWASRPFVRAQLGTGSIIAA